MRRKDRLNFVMVAWVVSVARTQTRTLAFLTTSRTASRSFRARTGPLQATAAASSTSNKLLQVDEEVGRGSYGTVHLCRLLQEGNAKKPDIVICKRAWNAKELGDGKSAKEKQERCCYYFQVEKHCFEKMQPHPQIPIYYGTFPDDQERHEWMSFAITGTTTKEGDSAKKPAPTLNYIMFRDWKDQHDVNNKHHHLYDVQKAMGMPEDASFAATLDVVIESLLTVLAHVHSQGIVHRDLKPDNLLCDAHTQSLVLIDFGSAADLDPVKTNFWGGNKRIGLEEERRVAVSPIYSAPEVFVRPDRAPFQFDVFSAALITFQLIFNFLDERMDAGFHQQLEDSNCDLDSWLSRELSSKVRPVGLEEALQYLTSRPGLWRLLGDMLRKDPEQRISSRAALTRFQQIREGLGGGVEDDGPFFASVVALMETCEIPPEGPMGPRPLHYVAAFRRHIPLGLVLAEADQDVDDVRWQEATADAEPGEVFIQDIVPGSQAARMGIFEVGDRLQGVGELPLANSGFEKVLEMLEQQPQQTTYVRLHFDRRSVREVSIDTSKDVNTHARVVQQGAWSAKGRRKAQEDTFVLQEIHDGKDILLAAVFDGHGGTAASHAASQLLPFLTSEELRQSQTVRQALEAAWEAACTTYRNGCDVDGCLADYDRNEGTLQASTSSAKLEAGTTATVLAIEEGEATILNCGDSRSLLVNKEGNLDFSTQDHKPEFEMERLEGGLDQGYSLPECSLSRWFLQVGDYQYAVSRSLEGPFATSKGIVSDPDVTTLLTEPGDILIQASDGLFEVMDNDEVGRTIVSFRNKGMSAGDAAKELCSMAMEKGTSDNVSAVVVYLE